MSFTLTVKLEDLADFRAKFPDYVEMLKDNIKSQLEKRAPAKIEGMLGRWQSTPPRLASAVDVSVYGDTIAMLLGKGVGHAPHVYFGAGEHIIRPKTGKALHWTRSGHDFFFGKVKHPGQPARIDIIRALQELIKEIGVDEMMEMIKVLGYVYGN